MVAPEATVVLCASSTPPGAVTPTSTAPPASPGAVAEADSVAVPPMSTDLPSATIVPPEPPAFVADTVEPFTETVPFGAVSQTWPATVLVPVAWISPDRLPASA